MRDLSEVRVDIDRVDNEILSLYKERLELVTEVAEYKISTGKKVLDPEREAQKIDVLSGQTDDDFIKHGVTELYKQIMSTSRKRQYQILSAHGLMDEQLPFTAVDKLDFNKKVVVFQGVPGAYSQQAMKEFFGPDLEESFHVDTWREAMEAIKSGKADYAVLPIENSSAGSITENYDLLAEYDVAIVGQHILKIDHALLGLKGAKVDDITTVISHPQAIMQCDRYIVNNHSEWNVTAMHNTAVSAMKVRDDGDIHQAAIGSPINAELYDLCILERGIQDNKNNQTKFIIVAKDKVFKKDADTVSICIEIANQKGSLYYMLSHFIHNGLDLKHIESRPLTGRNWEYRFFIEFTGNLQDDAVKDALLGLKSESSYLRILGNC